MAGKRQTKERKPRQRTKPEKCCISGCTRPAKRRGLCDSCYTLAYRALRAGRATWSDLERDGLAKPLAASQSPFRMAQAAARSK